MKSAVITGVTGQDGSYLSEYLLGLGYTVYGIIRKSSTFNTSRINHLRGNGNFRLIYGDLTDFASIIGVISRVSPDEVYNLGAQSHVRTSFDIPVSTVEINALGSLNLFEAARLTGCADFGTRIYQASSSEMFGNSPAPQNEDTVFDPRSPYACSKVYSYHQAKNYREAYGMFICNGICYNHESPRRGETFVTRKITRAATRIKLGLQDELVLGNLEARRDWGYAGDYVAAMHSMLSADSPDDYVIATGETRTVREFVDSVFSLLGLDWQEYVRIDPVYYRPTEVNVLCGDYSKARRKLGWEPVTKFADLVSMMVESDMLLAENELRERERK